MAIRNPEGVLEISDRVKADILNKHFSTIDEKIAGELPILNEDLTTYATRVTPTIMRTTLTPDVINKALLKLNQARRVVPMESLPGYLSLQETRLSHFYCQYLPQVRQPIPFL